MCKNKESNFNRKQIKKYKKLHRGGTAVFVYKYKLITYNATS